MQIWPLVDGQIVLQENGLSLEITLSVNALIAKFSDIFGHITKDSVEI